MSDQNQTTEDKRPNIKRWVLVTILSSLVLFLSVLAFAHVSNFNMSIHGYIALGLGIFMSVAVGVGLTVLLFYSSQHGYDEAAHVWVTDDEDEDN